MNEGIHGATPESLDDGSTLRPVTLTRGAARKVREAMVADGVVGHGLRIGVYGGGCAGLRYLMDYADRAAPDDVIDEQHGVTLYIDPLSAAYLIGTTVDWVEGPTPERSGFRFENPNVGCAVSGGVSS